MPNLFEKIIMAQSGQSNLMIGDIVEVEVSKVMIHDFFAVSCIKKFNEMGFQTVIRPDNVVFVFDHLVPATFIGDTDHHFFIEEFARSKGIKNIHRSDGVCHQLMHEQGYIKPGDIVIGTDSHTVTYGALGAIATGIGYTEMAAILGTGKLWLKIAPTIKINVNHTLPKGVFGKDVILEILRELKADKATYKILEFSGAVISDMQMDSRLTLCNMSVEAGAKAGIIAPDDKTIGYLKEHFPMLNIESLKSDHDAEYEEIIEFDMSGLEPLVSCPPCVDKVKKISELNNVYIDQAFLGSCTNGRLEDLKLAAKVLEKRKIHPDVRFIVVPASREIYLKALEAGYIETLVESGAILGHPACGLCCGRSGGILENGEKVISSNNRNFLGRMGDAGAEIYLGSPATVAASAVEGKIADCRNYL